jgi:hypothetical protein
MKNQSAVTAFTASTIHNKFRGDTTLTLKSLKKKKLELKHSDLEPELKSMRLGDLEPLESQRFVKDTWVKKRLEKQGGLDMWAFGALDVCYDPVDDKHYVWNGCGRFALAKMFALDQFGSEKTANDFKVPCLVIEGPKNQAAFYFGYNQDEGRRTLSKEVLFVNRHFSGDPQALTEASQLAILELHVKKDSDRSVPVTPTRGSIEISYRAFHEGLSIANNDISLMRQARDMIATAWDNPSSINQDIFWAVIFFLRIYPEARTNGVNASLQGFLKAIATLKNQEKIDWKFKGLSANKGVAPQLAYGLLKAFRDATKFWKPGFGNILTFKRLENYVDLDEKDQALVDAEMGSFNE